MISHNSIDYGNVNIENKWICGFCKKHYSKNYPYKSHLKRCLVHTEEQHDRYDMIGDLIGNLKTELTAEFKTELNNMLIELKQEIKPYIQSHNHQQHQNKSKPSSMIGNMIHQLNLKK